MIGTTHYFSVEDASQGQYRVTVRAASRALVVTSTRLDELRAAHEAMRNLCVALTQDWHYQIHNPKKSGPCFTIRLVQPKVLFVSRSFTSCDAMEREIASVKARASALITDRLHTDDMIAEFSGRPHGDGRRCFTAMLRPTA